MFNASITAEQVIPPLLRKMDNHSEYGSIYSWRVGLTPGPARRTAASLPALLTISSRHVHELSMDRMEDEGLISETDAAVLQKAIEASKSGPDSELLYVVDLFRPEGLQGMVEFEKSGRVRRADRAFALLVGRPLDSIATTFLMSMMAKPPPQTRLMGALGVKAGQHLGDPCTLDLQFVDGGQFQAQITVCLRNEEGTRMQSLVHVPPQGVPDPKITYRRIQEVIQKELKVLLSQDSSNAEAPTSRGVRFGGIPDKATESPVPTTSIGGTIGAMTAAKKFGKNLKSRLSGPSPIPEADVSTRDGVLHTTLHDVPVSHPLHPVTKYGSQLPQERASPFSMRSGFKNSNIPGNGPMDTQTTDSASVGLGRAPGASRAISGPTISASHRRQSAHSAAASYVDTDMLHGTGTLLKRNSQELGSMRGDNVDMMTLERMTSVAARSDLGDELTVADDDMASENTASDVSTHAAIWYVVHYARMHTNQKRVFFYEHPFPSTGWTRSALVRLQASQAV